MVGPRRGAGAHSWAGARFEHGGLRHPAPRQGGAAPVGGTLTPPSYAASA